MRLWLTDFKTPTFQPSDYFGDNDNTIVRNISTSRVLPVLLAQNIKKLFITPSMALLRQTCGFYIFFVKNTYLYEKQRREEVDFSHVMVHFLKNHNGLG